jgi:hypothetical protein
MTALNIGMAKTYDWQGRFLPGFKRYKASGNFRINVCLYSN